VTQELDTVHLDASSHRQEDENICNDRK